MTDFLRLTRTRGQVVIVGVPGIVNNVDLTPLFDKELQVNAAYIYHHAENFQGKTRRDSVIAGTRVTLAGVTVFNGLRF